MNDKYIFYKDKDGEICYNENCKKCSKKCKQSYRAKIISCPVINKNKKRG